jgi:hypothetical protein
MDAIIAATALVHGLTVWTQDDDFDVLAELAPGLVVKHDQVDRPDDQAGVDPGDLDEGDERR